MAPKKKEETKSSEFLIAEFNALQQRVITREQVKANRVNFLLILTSAFVAGVAGLYQPNSGNQYFSVIVSVASAVLLVLGMAILHYTVEDSICTIYFFRRAGRVRRYFLDADPSIAQYLAFEANDDHPKYKSGIFFHGSENVVMLLNNTSISALILSRLYLLINLQTTITIGVIVFFVAWILQSLYIKISLTQADKKYGKGVHFPNENA